MRSIKTSVAKARSLVSNLFVQQTQLAPIVHKSLHSEEPDYYKPGGFHPILLGDTFHDDRYTILRKLGYGQYSTVWLAKDVKCRRYVALKMLRADCYGGSHDIFETEILSKISKVSRQSSHSGSAHVSHLLDKFKHHGPNGEHVCLVFDVLGHHLGFQTARYDDGKLPVKAVKVIARQLLLGLDYLHRECGIIHTDIKPTNILLEIDNSDDVISQYLSNVPPRIADVERGTPLREVFTTPPISQTARPHIRIIDFGVASWRDNHLSDQIQPQALRAPEVTIGAPWDTGVDIWSLGCLIVELVQGIILFSGKASPNGTWTAEDDHLAKIIEVLGPFPPSIIRQGRRAAHFFNSQGSLFRIPSLKPTTLARLVNGTSRPFLKPEDMPDNEVDIFIDFIKGILTIDPSCRKSAAELLQHEWINTT